MFWLLAMCGGVVIGWILACEYYQHHPITVYVPSAGYSDGFADQLSGRIYDQSNTPLNDRLAGRWPAYQEHNNPDTRIEGHA